MNRDNEKLSVKILDTCAFSNKYLYEVDFFNIFQTKLHIEKYRIQKQISESRYFLLNQTCNRFAKI